MHRDFGGRIFLMFGNEAGALDEHAAGTAGGIEDAAVVWLEDFDEEADDAGRCVELAAFLAFGAGEFAEEIFVDAAKGVAIDGGRDFGEFF